MRVAIVQAGWVVFAPIKFHTVRFGGECWLNVEHVAPDTLDGMAAEFEEALRDFAAKRVLGVEKVTYPLLCSFCWVGAVDRFTLAP